MELYIFENYKELFPKSRGHELTDLLIAKAIRKYAQCDKFGDCTENAESSGSTENLRSIGNDAESMNIKNRILSGKWQIARTDKGKPYILWEQYAAEQPTSEKTDESFPLHISVSHSGSLFACIIGKIPLGMDIQLERRVNAEKICRRYFTEEENQYAEENGIAGFFKLWTRKEAYSKYTGKGLEEVMGGASIMDREDVEFFDFQLEEGVYCSCCVMKNEENWQDRNNIRVTKGEEYFEI